MVRAADRNRQLLSRAIESESGGISVVLVTSLWDDVGICSLDLAQRRAAIRTVPLSAFALLLTLCDPIRTKAPASIRTSVWTPACVGLSLRDDRTTDELLKSTTTGMRQSEQLQSKHIAILASRMAY